MRPPQLISHEPPVQIIRPSARRQIDGGSGALSEQEDVHGRWKHASTSAHWRARSRQQQTLAAKCHRAMFVRT